MVLLLRMTPLAPGVHLVEWTGSAEGDLVLAEDRADPGWLAVADVRVRRAGPAALVAVLSYVESLAAASAARTSSAFGSPTCS